MTSRNRSLQFVKTLLWSFLTVTLAAGGAGAASTFTVNSAGDGGDVNPGDGVCDDGTGRCTLRAAIQEANALPGADVIVFGIGSGPQTISPGSALPTITGPVTIDGTAQPGYAGSPIIELNGTGAGAGTHGLRITAGSSVVKGLVINRFGSNGILLETNGGNRVEGCFIGTDMTGAVALGNGSLTTDVTEQNGVSIVNAPNNIIGGTTTGSRNLISGNKKDGVYISGSAATGNTVQGNTIGTNLAGTAAIGNLRNGVFTGSNTTTVGGTDPNARNVISGNSVGVQIFGTGNVVQGNLIGTNASGTSALGNSQRGIELYGPSNTVGGVTASARNVISGNYDGIAIISTSGNRVQGNYIGTNATGTAALGNVREGVLIVTGAANNAVGGTEAGAGNLISGNGHYGVDITGAGVTGNTVQGNLIGADVTGAVALGNAWGGVVIQDAATNNTVGGAAAGVRNLISGNTGHGVHITSGAPGNLVQGNLIGTDVTGTAALGNTVDGVAVQSANNTIGGTAAGAGNLISGNRSGGVTVGGSGATGNRVLGNTIGTDLAGTAALGNLGGGVIIFSSASNNTVGGTDAGAGNLISGNKGNGVQINSSASGNVVQGNLIGTNVAGAAGLGNTLNGVTITNSASGNTIGGTAAGAGNTIAYNGSAGVAVSTGNNNAILGNAIYSNAGLGIDLDGTGVTANDVGDGDAGPNNLQNFPALTQAVAGGNTVSGTLNSSANTTFRVEFFSNSAADPTGYGEGQTFLGATTVTTDGSGNANFTASVPVSAGQFISATATDPNNNTSEFARSIQPITNRPPVATDDAATTNEDAAVDIAVKANDSDPDGDAVTVTAVTQGTSGSVAINPDGTVKYTPNADFNGSDSFTYTISDGQGGTATATVTVTVTPVNDAPTLGAISDPAAILEDAGIQTVTLSGVGTGAANESQALTVTAVSSNAALIPHPTVTYTSPGATGSLSYTPVANASGTATITVTVSDGVDTITRTFTVTVNAVNDAPTAGAGGPYGVDEGSSVAVAASGSDIDGDPLTFAWDLDNNGGFETPGQNVSFTGLDGPVSQTVTVKVTDSGGAWATAQATVQVRNVAPAVGAVTAPVDPVPVSTAVNASATFTDPGTPDTHTAVWAWGDGNTSSGAVNEETGSVSGSHTYAAAGVYRVTLTVTDDDGASDEAAFQFVVIYDPTAGFVTGGGWIDSPVGAYPANPSLTGKANFGFVAKYQKGASVPTGQTQFNFKVASLNFQSTAYEWLVVAGARAKFKGSGTINNSGDYGFMLTATDGQANGGGGVDKFWIKVWNKGTGGVIYDNQMGADDDADATDAIEGGSIVIHNGGAAKPVALARVGEAGEDAPAVPEAFGLDPNYPNPFNPATTIRYTLPEAAGVTLVVYNILGQQVRTLVSGSQGPGYHAVVWDGRDEVGRQVASGLYLYRLQAGTFVQVRKMLFAK